MKKWTIEDSKELYNINGWGTSYFGINDEGNVYVMLTMARISFSTFSGKEASINSTGEHRSYLVQDTREILTID